MPKGRQPSTNDKLECADDALVEDLLRNLDVGESVTSPALSAVAAKLSKRTSAPNKSQSPSAVAERRDYALTKLAEGKGAVRAYNRTDIAPRRLAAGAFESEEEYQRRYKREYARLTRGVTPEDIEARAFIRETTPLQEKKRKRAVAEKARRAAMTQADRDAEAKRKSAKRAAKKMLPGPD